MNIGKQKTILASLAVIVPLVAAIGIKKVSGSEPPGRLVVNADGTVTDSVTTLIWEQAPGQIVNAASCATSCSSLSLGTRTSGWRVPSVKELVSIVDFESATAPMIDTAAFPGTPTFTNGVSPAGIFQTTDGFSINFSTGVIGNTTNPTGEGTSQCRCVHSPP